MTYNFDPDRWLAMRLARLDDALAKGELDGEAHDLERRDLEQRYQAMVERLDGTYRLPDPRLSARPDRDES